jgi:hypothetical protein
MTQKNNAHSYEWQMINELLEKNKKQKIVIVSLCTIIVGIVIAFTLF